VTVTFADVEPNGLADLVGRLIETNLEADPGRRSLLRDTVVRLRASDAATEATVALSSDGVAVSNGPVGRRPHLLIDAEAYDLNELAGAPLRFGFPDAVHAKGRAVLRRIATRHVRVSGMVRHPIRLSRFTRLLSVVP
jgi:hypothetical protein